MTDISDIMQPRTMKLTEGLRWIRPSGTLAAPNRLQQAWRCIETGEIDWVDVPLVVEPSHD